MVTLEGLRNSPASCVHLILKLDGMKGGSFPVFIADDRGKCERKEKPVAPAKRSLKLQHHVQFIFLNFPGGTPENSWWGCTAPFSKSWPCFPGALPYISHVGMCPPPKGMVLAPFGSENAYRSLVVIQLSNRFSLPFSASFHCLNHINNYWILKLAFLQCDMSVKNLV